MASFSFFLFSSDFPLPLKRVLGKCSYVHAKGVNNVYWKSLNKFFSMCCLICTYMYEEIFPNIYEKYYKGLFYFHKFQCGENEKLSMEKICGV